MKKVLIISIIIGFLGCTNKNPIPKSSYDLFGFSEKGYVLKNNIKEINKFKIGLDLNDNPIWKRLESKKVFDKKGNLILEIKPNYVINEPKKTDSISDLSWFTSKEYNRLSLTNIPTKTIDTTYYFYDENENISKKIYSDGLFMSFKYDSNGNEIKRSSTIGQISYVLGPPDNKEWNRVVDYEVGETKEHFTKYIYREDSNIILIKKDSIPLSAVDDRLSVETIQYLNNRKGIHYKYDSLGRLIYNGNFREYDKNGQISNVSDGAFYYNITHDTDGNKTFVETYHYNKSWSNNFKDSTRVVLNNTFYQYDENNLLVQVKNLDNNFELHSLEKVTYTFFE